jgi:pilus assembly protein CpaE
MAALIVDNGPSKSAAPPTTVGLAIESGELWDEVQSCLRGLPVRAVLEHRELRNWSSFLERVAFLQPEVVLLDITRLAQPLEESVRAIRTGAPDAMLVVLHTAADPETILTAVRAGAHEFLYPPLEGSLRKALERWAEDRSRVRDNARPPGKILGFLSAKGGCGATTIACHLAAELGRLSTARAENVLLADLDMESGIVGFLMKVKPSYSVLDAVQNLHRLDLSYWKALISNGCPGLDVIVSPGGSLTREPVSGEPLRQVLGFVRSNYTWAVVDLGCTLNLATLTVLEEIDEIYLVTTLEVPSLHQAKQAVQTLVSASYGNRMHVILNRTPQRPDVTAEELERILGLPIDIMLPNDYYALYDAFCKGKLLPANTHLSRQITSLAMRLAGVPAEKSKRRFGLFG